jgi:rubredoxin
MRLVFDGRLKWICPYCGNENAAVMEYIHGWARMEFELTERHIVIGDRGKLVALDEIPYDDDIRCPSCEKLVSVKDIRGGFHEWLEKLKGENPKEYAEILSEMLET